MSKDFAQIVSTIINPIALISLIPYILIHKTTSSTEQSLFWSGFSFVFIIIFSIFVLLGLKLGYFSNLNISNRKERTLLYSFAIVLSLVYLLSLYILSAPLVLFMGVTALALGLAIGEVINIKIKLSIHVGTLVAFVTSLVLIYGAQFASLYILVPLVGWARLKTLNHTLLEIILGGTVGFFLTLVVYGVFQYII